jgi:membrane protein required for colicin V production
VHLTLFDIIAILLLAVSALVGLVRGALREITTVAAFIIAALGALFALRFVGHLARSAIHPPWLGNVVALLAVFLAIYIAIRALSGGLIRSVQGVQGLGAIDRLIGAGLGLARGLVMLGLINIAIHLAPPATGEPAWILNARLYPLSERCAAVVRAIVPKGLQAARSLTPEIEKAVRSNQDDADSRSDVGQSGESRYDRGARRSGDEPLETTR